VRDTSGQDHYLLRYVQDAAIRDRVQLQLNRGESRAITSDDAARVS
jgi:hypothetical protein